MNEPIPHKLYQKFFSDPDWQEVEKIIRSYIDPMHDITTIDITQSAEDVKTELKGRLIAYKQLEQFLTDAQLISKKLENQNPSFK